VLWIQEYELFVLDNYRGQMRPTIGALIAGAKLKRNLSGKENNQTRCFCSRANKLAWLVSLDTSPGGAGSTEYNSTTQKILKTMLSKGVFKSTISITIPQMFS
jgi:hypothetical protein